MSKNQKIIILTIATVAIAAAAIFVLRFFQAGEFEKFFRPNKAENDANQKNNATETYSDDKYNFTFNYPADFNVTAFGDEKNGGYTILAEGKGDKNSFQIFIQPFDDPPTGGGPITPERVKKDLPKAIIDDPKTVMIAGKSIPALIFYGKSESIGRTREIWFVKNKNLYQVTAYDNMDATIGPILDSLKFN